MNRKLFFWIEKLKISRNERGAVLTLLILLVSLVSIGAAVHPSSPFSEKKYATLDREFKARTVKMQKQHERLMVKYHGEKPEAALVDTAQKDTVKAEKVASKSEQDGQNLINVNTADEKTLQQLHGIGPTYAHRIAVYRQTNGPFKIKDELKKIKGIGKKRLAKIKPFIKLTDQ